ncbi:VCBS domain-containing protein [Catenovulum maritimum]|uniref:Uncharacterized protein n=1 Tax=Catenovulum maritimum TaxID=1513271 RepID=A0A0J8GWA5_9ALTE|nr:VCBS domain-containing protein [Catenovulum maritimum]KMT67050.1 hypothetical protein XM47_00155 [Catenovulum maritimum]
MKKQFLAISIMAALTGCDLDNLDDLKVQATFDNAFKTEVGFSGTEGAGFDVELTTGHGQASGTLVVNDVNYGEAEPNYELTPEAMYGTFTLSPLQSGYATWRYDLDETNPKVAEILDVADATLTDSLTITTLDGTTKTINFIIKGVDPTLPAEVRGALIANASIRETSAFGSVTAYDPNFGQSKLVANATFDPTSAELSPTTFDDIGKAVGILSDKGFGSLFISEQGAWEFKVNRNAKNPEDDTQTLKDMLPEPDSTPVTDTVTFTTIDGTATTMDINIYGAVPNFVARIVNPDPVSTDPNANQGHVSFRIDMDVAGVSAAAAAEGKLVFKARISEDLTKPAIISMSCNSNWHPSAENRRLASFYIKPDGQFEMWSGELKPGFDHDDRGIPSSMTGTDNKVVFDQGFVPGEWSEFTLTWEGAGKTTKALLEMWLDGERLTSDHPAIPTDPTQKVTAQNIGGFTVNQCLNQLAFYIKKSGDNDTGGVGDFLVDDIQYYTDINAIPKTDADTKALLNEKFANNVPGDVVKEITVGTNKPYSSYTTEDVLVVKD